MFQRSSCFTVLCASAALAAGAASANEVGPFNGPVFDIATAPNGDLIVADASTGIIRIGHRGYGFTTGLPGVTGISPQALGFVWAVTGAGGMPPDPASDTGQALHLSWLTHTREVANLFEFEVAYNPHMPGMPGAHPESNPYAVLAVGSRAYIADAAANDLLKSDHRGNLSVVAVFPDELVSTANIKTLAGCPLPPEDPNAGFCNLPPMLPAQPVPTSIARGPDGYLYVGELKGFPGPTGQSNIWRVSPHASWAQCGASPDCVKVFEGGFTSIIDLAFGPDGKLYVAELDEASWASIEIFGQVTGGTISRCRLATKSCSVVETGIPMLTALAFGKRGTLWYTRNALVPGGAEVVKLAH